MQKILFLDFDGVLHPPPTSVPGSWQVVLDSSSFFLPALVQRVLRIVRETGCEIVVSSAWRVDFSVDQFNQIFDGKVTGITPTLDLPISAYKEGLVRYREVQDYLAYEVTGTPSWVAIDDQSKHFPEQPNIVITDPQIGVTEQQADLCIKLLQP